MYDTILTDFPRLNGEKDDSARIQRAIDATPNGILCIPKGDYLIASPLFIRNRCSLDMHPAARLIAVEEMDFVITYDGNGNWHELTIYNDDGTIYDSDIYYIKFSGVPLDIDIENNQVIVKGFHENAIIDVENEIELKIPATITKNNIVINHFCCSILFLFSIFLYW